MNIIQNQIQIKSSKMDEQNQQYLLQIEKLMSSEIAAAFWAPTMDILVIATFDNLLEGYRISFKAQRFFRIEQSQSIQTLCFSPDSQFIAYSLLDGSIKIIKTENGEKVISVQNLGSAQIESLSFVPFTVVNPQQFMPFNKNSIESKLIPNISPHKNCNKNAIIKINYFNELRDSFSCLLLSEKKKLWLLLNGFVPIACVDYSNLLKQTFTNSEFRILYSHLDEKLYSIVAEEVESTFHLSLIVFQATTILDIKDDIVKYNCLISNITEIINFIQTTYVALQTCLKDIIRQYNSKINLIDDSNSQNVNPRQELLNYLSIGLTSSTLTNFLTKQIYDTKVLQKLDETLTSLFTNLHDIIIESVQNGLEKATLLLLKLSALSQVKKYEQLGITTKQFKQIEQKIIRLYTLGEMLLVESTQTKFNIRNLLIWLNKASIKTCQENETEIENAKSYLNKYTVDYSRLYKFLSSQDIFRLQNLLRFFRKTDDKKVMTVPQADFLILSDSFEKSNKKTPSQEQLNLYHFLENQLELEDIVVQKSSPMDIQHSFYSFKNEINFLITTWRQLSSKPYLKVGEKLSKYHRKIDIGKVVLSQLFSFDPKFINMKNELCMYYIDRGDEQSDRIVKFNFSTQTKQYLYVNEYTLLNFSVAEDIIGIFQQKMSQKKVVAQIANQSFDGGLIKFGRMINNCDQGQLSVSCSSRGLNSLVIGKTKLVIFD